ncbi:MAG: CoA transferase [Alphaproteobacteria bacterium]|nr:CoA transferase [Alphaproteobacteria bacterium]
MTALKGLKVIDMSRVLAGPYCTQMLGDMGAEVIKIEKPGMGDDTRGWGPPYLKDADGNDTTESAYYLSINRNKKSVALDVATEEGQTAIHSLLQDADIFIENFKVGGLKKYGLSYEQLKDKYPRLIYCGISGYGQEGPLSSEPGYDFVAQGYAGLMASTGVPDGEPMKVGVAVSDILAGMHACVAILAALHAREKTGKGQMVDVALTDCTLATMTNLAQYYLTSGKVPQRRGNQHATIVPYQAFKTADGHIVISVGNDKQFALFAKTLQKDWATDARFATNKNRVIHREVLVPLIEPEIVKKTTAEWLGVLRAADIPCGPVNTMDKIFADAQILSRGMKIEMQHPLSDKPIALVGSPLKFSATPVEYKTAPPVCGQHTDEVLKKKG